jgi:nucleoside-triphosphatase
VTGEPGSGKTTVLRKVAAEIQEHVPIRGFFTEEIRTGRAREGFRGVTFDGRTFPLAHRKTPGPLRVGAYGVELTGLETVGLEALVPRRDTRIVIVDEIGKMELLSTRFRSAIEVLLASDVPLLASIALHGVGFVKRLRHDPRVTLLRLRADSRYGLVGEILRRLAAEGIVPAKSKTERPP